SALTGGGTTARLWDAETGKQKVVFEGPKELRKDKPKQNRKERPHEIWGACFSPDGQSVLTISAEFPVQLFDARTGQVKAVFEVSREGRIGLAMSACFSPDGSRVLIGGDCFGGNGGWVWEPETGREQAIAGYLTSVCFSPDGRYALTGNKNDDT